MVRHWLASGVSQIKHPRFKHNTTGFAKDGRSYKLYVKSDKLWKCRFNKTNPNYFLLKNVKRVKIRRYKHYMLFPFWKNRNLQLFNVSVSKIRPFNTYTNRGILDKSTVFHKRQGRISGYV